MGKKLDYCQNLLDDPIERIRKKEEHLIPDFVFVLTEVFPDFFDLLLNILLL